MRLYKGAFKLLKSLSSGETNMVKILEILKNEHSE